MKSASKYFCLLWMPFLAAYSCSEKQDNQEDQRQTNRTTGGTGIEASDGTDSMKTVLFFGNSITAGYGLDLSEAFPALIGEKLKALGLPYRTVNAGLSGETSAGGNSRTDWILKQRVDVFVLELGGNDGLRGIDPDDTYQNLKAIVQKVKDRYPGAKIIVAGMEAPPNMGEEYTERFRSVFPRVAEEEGALLIPFILEGVAGIPSLNLEDGIHPTAEGHKRLAETVWSTLEAALESQG